MGGMRRWRSLLRARLTRGALLEEEERMEHEMEVVINPDAEQAREREGQARKVERQEERREGREGEGSEKGEWRRVGVCEMEIMMNSGAQSE